MADAIVRGEIKGRNETDFRSTLTCGRRGASGSIRGEMDVESRPRDVEYTFASNSPIRIAARKSGVTRFVEASFDRGTLTNRRTGQTIRNARIAFTARKLSNGRRQATMQISSPGRATLRASGVLDDGRVFVGRTVACSRRSQPRRRTQRVR